MTKQPTPRLDASDPRSTMTFRRVPLADLHGIGFEPVDIDALLAELGDKIEPGVVDDPGPVEPPEKPTSRRGDLLVLGHHRLLCGDSTSGADLVRLLAGDRAHLLATDPPYCVGSTGAERPDDTGTDWSDKYRAVDIQDLAARL